MNLRKHVGCHSGIFGISEFMLFLIFALSLGFEQVPGKFHSRNARIAFGSSDSVIISWQTDDPNRCNFVNFGVSVDTLDHTAALDRTCGIYKGDTIMHAKIYGVSGSSHIYYKLACSDEVLGFSVSPSRHSHGSVTFGVFADLGPVKGEESLKRLSSIEVDGFIFAGDIGYADDAFMHATTYISRLNDFLNRISPIASHTPVMVVPGNHEAEDHTPVCLLSPSCRSGYGNFSAYNCLWSNPSYNVRHHNMWYSFDYGPIHFVMTNTETDYSNSPLEPYGEAGFIPTGQFGLPGEYERWLQQDLESAPSESFIVVVGHRPITVLDNKTDPFVTPLNDKIISLINKYADIYVSGHVHYYTRSVPKSPPLLPTLISVGGAGCDEWDQRTIQDTRRGETNNYEYFAYGEEQSIGTLQYNPEKPNELVFNAIRSRDGQIIDTVVVTKRQPPLPASQTKLFPYILVE